MPMGFCARISSTEAVQGRTTEKTFCSRMRRAMSCVYWLPKSRMTIEEVSTSIVYLTRMGSCAEGACAWNGRVRLARTG